MCMFRFSLWSYADYLTRLANSLIKSYFARLLNTSSPLVITSTIPPSHIPLPGWHYALRQQVPPSALMLQSKIELCRLSVVCWDGQAANYLWVWRVIQYIWCISNVGCGVRQQMVSTIQPSTSTMTAGSRSLTELTSTYNFCRQRPKLATLVQCEGWHQILVQASTQIHLLVGYCLLAMRHYLTVLLAESD
jgi:hypothetical protein